MGYMQDVDRWLEELLQDFAEGRTFDDLKRAIREKILESYRNGQDAEGHSPAPRPKSRSEKKQAARPQRFTGNWQCSQCGGAITSLPFEPKGEERRAAAMCLLLTPLHNRTSPAGMRAG